MEAKPFDLVVRSTIIRSEKPNKGLEAIQAATQHQMNRIIGFLPDGTKAIIAQRPGRGGMDFNKILGGKVFAVAADGTSPVFEKDKDGKPTKTQKVEDGLPLYSSSGFYMLSSKEYPALDMAEYYSVLRNEGEQVILVSDAQLKNVEHIVLESDMDLEMDFKVKALAALADDQNLVSRFDSGINNKRRRGIERARDDAQDAGEAYQGVEFKDLVVSPKDGNPAIIAYWQVEGEKFERALILRERPLDVESPHGAMEYLDNQGAWDEFCTTPGYARISSALDAGKKVTLHFVQAHVMRTSVSFRRKVVNVMAEPADKPQYGDAVYIKGALKGWCRAIVGILHSQHPNFPQADYEAHHYVATVRQAEIGMSKKADQQGWLPPMSVATDLFSLVLKH